MKVTNIAKRIGTLAVLLLSLFLFPWWVSVGFGILFVLFFEDPYEIFVFGIMLDGFYGVAADGFFSSHIFIVATALFFIFSIWIKEHFMFKF